MHRRSSFRFLWCLLGMAVGIGVTLSVTGTDHSPLLLASLGGTAVFLFGFTRAPAVQPRSVFGGHLGAALIGIACYQAFGEALWVYVLAQTLALGLMLLTRTVHPPAGANPILMVHAHGDWSMLFQPVLLGIGSLVLVAMLWSRLYPGLCRYPVDAMAPSPEHINWGGWSD